jgi:hypothetical protein
LTKHGSGEPSSGEGPLPKKAILSLPSTKRKPFEAIYRFGAPISKEKFEEAADAAYIHTRAE